MKDRIKKIMENEDLTASRFADRLEINRAVVSHILTGRNNPSLDVVTKILLEMDYINSDWLLRGEGSMYKDGFVPKDENERTLFDREPVNEGKDTDVTKYAKEMVVESGDNIAKADVKQSVTPIPITKRKVRQIIIYYDDNTFETFGPH